MPSKAQQLAWAISARQHDNFVDCRSSARLLFQGSRAVKDPQVVDYINSIFKENLIEHGLTNPSVLKQFTVAVRGWIDSHNSSTLVGLDAYQIDFSAGTTQSFDSFYYRHHGRRMRCFVGEYFYHLKTWNSNNVNWAFITDDDPLVAGDALVISLPFCDTGSIYPNFDNIIERCEQQGIPVLVDCCYYAISGGVEANLDSVAIDTVAFSLSKAFPIANLRIGVRFTKPEIFDGQKLHDSINYNNSVGAYIGLKIIEKFSSNYVYNTYKQKQLEVCDYFNLVAGDSVIFATGDSQWDCYNRSNLLNSYQLTFDVLKIEFVYPAFLKTGIYLLY